MSGEPIRIGELRVRVPDISNDEARPLGQEVARHLSEQLPLRMVPQQLGALEVKVPVPQGAGRERLPQLISEAILKALA